MQANSALNHLCFYDTTHRIKLFKQFLKCTSTHLCMHVYHVDAQASLISRIYRGLGFCFFCLFVCLFFKWSVML